MKNRFRITAIILTLAITFIAHPFSVLKANSYIYNGTFTGGRYDRYTYTGSDTIYMQIDGTTIQGNSITVFNVYFDEYYTGTFRISFGKYFSPDAFNVYVKGGIIDSVTNKTSTSGYYTISFENTNFVTVTLSSYNELDNKEPSIGTFSLTTASGSSESTLNSIDISLTSAAYTLQQILDLIGTPGDASLSDYLSDIQSYIVNIDTTNTQLLNYIESMTELMTNSIGYFLYQENFNSSGYTYFTETINDLGTNKYTRTTSEARSINRIGIYFNTSSMINGNYFVLQYYFMSSTSLSDNAFNRYAISIRDSSNLVITLNEHYDYYLTYYNSNINQSVYIMTVYIPLYYMAEYQNGTYYVDINGISVPNVITSKITFIGIVESLPDKTPDNYTKSTTEQSLDQTASDINDAANQSNQIEQQYVSDLTDFKNNLDLSDYDFSLHSNSGFTYLKEKLQDIYEINEFKPFYLVPIIFMVLTVILGG